MYEVHEALGVGRTVFRINRVLRLAEKPKNLFRNTDERKSAASAERSFSKLNKLHSVRVASSCRVIVYSIQYGSGYNLFTSFFFFFNIHFSIRFVAM